MSTARNLINSGTFLTYDANLAIDWAAGVGGPGTLGQMPQCPLGIYDLRPWEGRPKGMIRDKDFSRQTTAAPGGELVIRFTRAPSDGQGSIFFGSPGEDDYQRFAATTLLIGAWDQLNNELLGNQNERPITASQRSVANKATRMGPNVTPLLQGAGAAEIDLLQWSGGARFVAIWAWTFWANVAAIPTHQLIWEVRDRAVPGPPTPEDGETIPGPWASPRVTHAGLVQTVTWPVRAVVDGPLVVGDPSAVFRWSSFADGNVIGIGAANGGPVPIDVEIRQRIGAQAYEPAILAAIPAGGVAVTPGAVLRPYSNYGFYASNTGAAGFLGGPLLLSVSGSSAGAPTP